ncbi:MAG: Crp/Fnr family transcriptional regulator [Clostridiales Family XIII bacterium]|nr:Crp/Fnr family transcriptional regulator [Clostridiales Family XIII bacterium]
MEFEDDHQLEDTLPSFRLNGDPPALEEWRKIFLAQKPVKYPKKTILIRQGEHDGKIYYLIDGLVEYTYTDKTGAEKLMEIMGAGSVLNLQPLFGGNAALGDFVTLEESKIASIKKDDLYRHMENDKRLAEELLEEMAKIISGLMRQIWINAENTNRRTEQVICLLAENRLRHNPGAKTLLLRFSQSDLARITRTTRVTITKILRDLKQKGFVETAYGGILIKDFEGLKKRVRNREP